MDNKNTVESRWEKLNKRSKLWHQFIGASLIRNVFLMISLIVVLEIIDGHRYEDYKAFILTATIKILIAYIIGIIGGGLEWNYLEQLIHKKFTEIKTIKRRYILIYGLLLFGTNVTIALLNPAFESLILTSTKLAIYPLAGLAWGAIMVSISGSRLDRFIAVK